MGPVLLERADLNQSRCPERQKAVAVGVVAGLAEHVIQVPVLWELLMGRVFVELVVEGFDLLCGANTPRLSRLITRYSR